MTADDVGAYLMLGEGKMRISRKMSSRMNTSCVLAAFVPLILLATTGIPLASAAIIYNNLPNPMPPSSPSLGFQSAQTAEFGDLVQIASGATLVSANVLMTDWARFSDYPSFSPAGFDWPVTITFYNITTDMSGTPQPGTVIGTVTTSFTHPWQPVSPMDCADATKFLGSDGMCHHGFNYLIQFALPNIVVPTEFIYGITYNTQGYGPNPGLPGSDGPVISLNLGLNNGAPPTIGTRPLPDTAYWNTTKASNYTDNGAGGVGTFRQDTAWTPLSAAASFSTVDTVPEPGTFGFLGVGLLVIGGITVRKRIDLFGSVPSSTVGSLTSLI